MKPTKEQIKQYYSQALARSLELYGRLEEKEWGKKASDRWTARDYLAHMVVTQEEMGNGLTSQTLAGKPADLPGYRGREGINEYNDERMATARGLSVAALLGRLKTAVEQHLSMLDGLGEADLDKPVAHPGWDRPGTLRDLFFSSYLHLPGHYQDIRRVSKRKLPHWVEASAPDEVHFQMDRIFNFMPLIFRSDRGQDMQATYLFTMEGQGGGQWAIQIAGGKAESLDGAPTSFDTEVKTKPELWIDLSTNDLNPMWAITTRKVQLGGNAGLAMKLGQLFQVSP
ncbi:MAG TPA: DinB family protein [Dehalococcoidia bacterium]|nr:DinB family protein [Dehalococcoidia bacterium]